MSNFDANLADHTALAGRYAIVASRFNEFVVDRLIDGAVEALNAHGIDLDQIDVVRVPGAFELPQGVAQVLQYDQYTALIALGCVIRGGTPHFDYVSSACVDGIGRLAEKAECALTMGVLTTDDVEQAVARAGEGPDNKGHEAAIAALELVSVLRQLRQRS